MTTKEHLEKALAMMDGPGHPAGLWGAARVHVRAAIRHAQALACPVCTKDAVNMGSSKANNLPIIGPAFGPGTHLLRSLFIGGPLAGQTHEVPQWMELYTPFASCPPSNQNAIYFWESEGRYRYQGPGGTPVRSNSHERTTDTHRTSDAPREG